MTSVAPAWQWGDVDASDEGERTCLAHRRAAARLCVDKGRLVRGPGYEGATATVRQELARVGAIVRLRQRGRYLVHAAGAVDPKGRAWLLAGDSGSGKSTLAYALARDGWTVLGDDGVLIERAGHGLLAHAWRDPLRVSLTLAGIFPEVGSPSLRRAVGDARERVSIVARGARSAPVAAIVLIERAAEFAIAAVSPVSALAALVRQSPWVILDDAYARPHRELLGHAASQPVFRLRHTAGELLSIAAVLQGVMA